MSVDTTIAVLYAQTGMGTQFAHAAAVAPHASVAVSRVLAMETAKQEKQTVQKTSEAEQEAISKDGQKKEKPALFGSRRRSRKPDPPEETPDPAVTPYTGTFLNLTV